MDQKPLPKADPILKPDPSRCPKLVALLQEISREHPNAATFVNPEANRDALHTAWKQQPLRSQVAFNKPQHIQVLRVTSTGLLGSIVMHSWPDSDK